MEKNRNELKNRFKKGAKPTEQDYADLMDSFLHRLEDNFIDKLPDATTTKKGVVEQATLAEVESGEDTTRFVTPQGTKRAVEKHAPVQSVNGKTGVVIINEYQEQDSGWINLTLPNGIINFEEGYEVARYRKKNEVVFIEGLVKGPASEDNKSFILFTLPVDYRPKKQLIFTTMKVGHLIIRIDVWPGGEVYCYDFGAGWTSISGISFLVD